MKDKSKDYDILQTSCKQTREMYTNFITLELV